MAAVAAAQPIVLGVDVGGTKIAAGQVVGSEAREHVEQPTELTSGQAIISEIEAVVSELASRVGPPAAVGIGLPSQIDFESGRIVASVNIPLAGVALGDELEARLGAPVFLDNDANCAALAEAHFVPEGPASHLVMLTLGTGVGGGVVIDGRIFRGATGLGAELGHVVVDADGPPCPGTCPNRGCLEALCSGTALERDGAQLARDRPDSALGRAAAGKHRITGLDVQAAAEAGDTDALELFDRLGRFLGVGIAGFINIFEPEHVVIGGGLSRASALFLERAEREARARALPALEARVAISLARAGADSGVVGAGLLALQELNAANRDTATSTATEGIR